MKIEKGNQMKTIKITKTSETQYIIDHGQETHRVAKTWEELTLSIADLLDVETPKTSDLLSEAEELMRVFRQGSGIGEGMENSKNMDAFLSGFGIEGRTDHEGGGITSDIIE